MTPPSLSPDWLPWGSAAFERARDAQRPILLTIGTTWSLGCAEMNRTTYRDPSVLELVNDSFVPVWVDADDRPDIGDRYGLGGWPTIAFLTADGRLLGGQTFTEPSPMVLLLTRVAEAFNARRAELSVSAERERNQTEPEAGPISEVAPAPDLALEAWLLAHLQDAYDGVHGGFGRASKRLQSGPLLYALTQCGSRNAPLRPIVTHTIDAAVWGPLFDQVDGGLFRYAAHRDWTGPAGEKLLTVNAGALEVLVESWATLDDERYRDGIGRSTCSVTSGRRSSTRALQASSPVSALTTCTMRRTRQTADDSSRPLSTRPCTPARTPPWSGPSSAQPIDWGSRRYSSLPWR